MAKRDAWLRAATFLRAVLLLAAICPGRPTPAAGADDVPPDMVLAQRRLMLVRAGPVQRELSFSAEQVRQMDRLIESVDQPLWQLRDVPWTEKADRVQSLLQPWDAGLRDVLLPKQRTRLEQLVVRSYDLPVLTMPVVADPLRLSDEQRATIAGLLVEAAQAQTGSDGAAAPSPKELRAIEQRVIAVLTPDQQRKLQAMVGPSFDFSAVPRIAARAPEIAGATGWIHTEPLTLGQLRGRVVVLHFYAFGCINCQRNYPWYQGWHRDFAGRNVVVLGVHTPETEAERSADSVRASADQHSLDFPIALDNGRAIWNAWANPMWPSVYLIDKEGHVRYWWYGELAWQGAQGEPFLRGKIEELLAE